jgi:putative transposase
LVFVTKYRHPVFTDAHLSRLEDIFQAVCADFGCDLVEYNGEAEHVHLLVTYLPTVQLSRLVNSLKGVSSRRLRQEFPERPGITGGPDGCGPAPTSPAASAVPR